MESIELINSSIEKCAEQIENSKLFLSLSQSQLTYKHSPNKWSINECFEHLNCTLDLYLPRIEHEMNKSSSIWVDQFAPGFWGKKMWNNMLPDEKGNVRKMKTFKVLDPNQTNRMNEEPILSFISKLKKFILLIENSKKRDLNKIRITSAIGSVLRFKLGDAILFMVNHNARHIWQAEKLK